ncbi:MAG: DNA polymerase III subunit gamma/tau [Acidobacteriota bacterium]
MTYQVIARKWRPQTFEEVTGQETVTRTLRNALEHDRLHHAYLFSGARGVGKTTTARLLAKALNCHKTDKPNLFPCRSDAPDACPSCVEISESRSMDVLEIDAASHTGIDAVRDTILEGVNINPARDRYKVFIIDEVHQLSKAAFNALLKTLEEPPPRVVFIMATTELHKVPETILSRCQEFQFRTIQLPKILERLKVIADAEKITIEDQALREIARSGEGSMRDAQSNFDQVISFSGDKITVADVSNALGLASIAILKRVVEAISTSDSKAVLDVVDGLVSQGQDTRNFCRDLLGLFRDLLVLKVSGGSADLLEGAVLAADEMTLLAEPFSPSDLIRFFNSIAETETKLREATQSRFVLEIGLVKLVEMRRLADLSTVIERLNQVESSLAGVELPVAKAASAAAPEKKTLIPEIKGEARVESETVSPEPELLPVENDVRPAIPPNQVPVNESLPEPAKFDLSFIDTVPVRLPQITSEELEHADDDWLDSAYERKLAWTGDELGPIANADQLIKALDIGGPPEKGYVSGLTNGNGSAAVRILERPYLIPKFDDEISEIVELPEDPTEEQMLRFANAQPIVKQALRAFRGKIVEVSRRPPGK